MAHEVTTQWMGKMQFNALVNGHTTVMDAPERAGGEDNGPIPKPFVLVALSGCTGMDVVGLLKKGNVPMDDLDIHVTGEISKTHPIQYTSMHLAYDLKGPETSRGAALQAISDSQEKYCGVSAMLKKALPVTWEIKYNGQNVFDNRPRAQGAHAQTIGPQVFLQ